MLTTKAPRRSTTTSNNSVSPTPARTSVSTAGISTSAKNIQEHWFAQHRAKGGDETAFAMLLCFAGPKAEERLSDNCVEILPECFIIHQNRQKKQKRLHNHIHRKETFHALAHTCTKNWGNQPYACLCGREPVYALLRNSKTEEMERVPLDLKFDTAGRPYFIQNQKKRSVLT